MNALEAIEQIRKVPGFENEGALISIHVHAATKRIEELEQERDSEIEECRKWSIRNMTLRDWTNELEKEKVRLDKRIEELEALATRRAERVDAMRTWLQRIGFWEDSFLVEYPEAKDWFDDKGKAK